MTFIKQLQPRAEILTNDAYASLWKRSGDVCPSICRALCDWLAVTKVIKEPVFYKLLTAKRSSLITEQELYRVYLRILGSKADKMTSHELLLGYSKWKSHHVVQKHLYKTDLCKSSLLNQETW